MLAKIRNVFRGFKQKWGSASAKRRMWNREYAVCSWRQEEEAADTALGNLIRRYARRGNILDLGCGAGNTVGELSSDTYDRYTGVDVSDVALEKAAARAQANGAGTRSSFQQSDILNFEPRESFDVILFRESVYYVPLRKLRSVLERYAQHLKEDGVFIVTVFDSTAYGAVLTEIEAHFSVADKYASQNKSQTILVFRRRPANSSETTGHRSVFTVGSLQAVYEYASAECALPAFLGSLLS